MPIPNDKLKAEVIAMLQMVKPLSQPAIRSGVSEWELNKFEQNLQFKIPSELCHWLKICNGANVNPGGLFGLDEMAERLEWHPSWLKKGWIPIASNGCGDNYVLVTSEIISTSRTHPVIFVDQSDHDQPAYVVASGLWRFLRFLFENEITNQESPPILDIENEGWYERMVERLNDPTDKCYWPFKKEKVLLIDPSMSDYEGNAPFPWDLELE